VKAVACMREEQTTRAVIGRCWPDGVDEELRAHASSCPECLEIVMVATALREAHDEAMRDTHVPAAGQIWWRAALRAHTDSVRAARRPIVWLQGIAAACAAGLVMALFGSAWPVLRHASAAAWGVALPIADVLRSAMPFALAVLACLVVTPIVVYFVLSDD
jgi:hypothetical protein